MDNQHRHVSYDDCEKSASLSKKIFVAFGHENDSPHFADIVVHIHALCNFYLCLRWQHIHHTCHLAGWFGSTKYFQILSTGCKKHFLKLDFPTVLQRWAFSTRKWLQQIRDSGIYFEHRSGLQHNSKQALTTDERYRVNTPHNRVPHIPFWVISWWEYLEKREYYSHQDLVRCQGDGLLLLQPRSASAAILLRHLDKHMTQDWAVAPALPIK